MRSVVAVVAAWIGGCSYHGRDPGAADGPPGVPDADPLDPDAPPAPDADPTTPDGAPDAASIPDAPIVTIDAAPCPSSYNDAIVGSSRYRTVNGANDWNSAVSDCANDGATTHLAVLSSDVERLALAGVMDRPRFVGISDKVTEGTWLPVTDEDVSGYAALYVDENMPPWGSGEPDNSGDCVMMLADFSLEDRDCVNDDQAYLCECDAYPDDPANH
jgi:hypothetical protein